MKSNDFQIKVLDRLNAIDIKQGEMGVSLVEHMRRTALLESNLESVKNDMKPIQKHVMLLEGITKVIGFAGVVTSIVYGIARVISLIFC